MSRFQAFATVHFPGTHTQMV